MRVNSARLEEDLRDQTLCVLNARKWRRQAKRDLSAWLDLRARHFYYESIPVGVMDRYFKRRVDRAEADLAKWVAYRKKTKAKIKTLNSGVK